MSVNSFLNQNKQILEFVVKMGSRVYLPGHQTPALPLTSRITEGLVLHQDQWHNKYPHFVYF